MRQVVEQSHRNATAILGQSLERLDAIVQKATEIMLSDTCSPDQQMRAAGRLQAAEEARIRWVGVVPERMKVELTRTEVHCGELAGLSGDALDRELVALGVRFVDPGNPAST